MLSSRWLFENKEKYEISCKKRNITPCYQTFLDLYQEYKDRAQNEEKARYEQKSIKEASSDGLALKNLLTKLTAARSETENKLNAWLQNQPNILLDEVPYGTSENDNIVVFESKYEKKNGVPPHYNLIKNLIMKEEAALLSGSRFVVFKKDLSKLKSVLAKFFLDNNEKEGYEEYSIPYMVNEKTLFGLGQLPKFAEDAFSTTTGKWLISTGEVGLVGIYQNYVFKEEELPKLCTTYSPCYRSEAGSAGRDTQGLVRLHQFHKVELVSICEPADSEKYHLKQLECAKNILNALKLPYRVILLCGADTGFCGAKQYDIEVWMPGLERYLEVASCSQCGDFQAVRSNIRYKKDGKMQFVHTLNGSSLPIERIIAAIVENGYVDGKIMIPECLRGDMKADFLQI